MAATARVVVLMEPEQKVEIAKRASRDGVSVGEFVRRSVWNAITDDMLEAELEARRHEFEPLLDELERRNADALASIDQTLAHIDRVLADLGTRRSEDEPGRSNPGQHQDGRSAPREA
jgi:hypothetical protein